VLANKEYNWQRVWQTRDCRPLLFRVWQRWTLIWEIIKLRLYYRWKRVGSFMLRPLFRHWFTLTSIRIGQRFRRSSEPAINPEFKWAHGIFVFRHTSVLYETEYRNYIFPRHFGELSTCEFCQPPSVEPILWPLSISRASDVSYVSLVETSYRWQTNSEFLLGVSNLINVPAKTPLGYEIEKPCYKPSMCQNFELRL
jgi:hypothetical protein